MLFAGVVFLLLIIFPNLALAKEGGNELSAGFNYSPILLLITTIALGFISILKPYEVNERGDILIIRRTVRSRICFFGSSLTGASLPWFVMGSAFIKFESGSIPFNLLGSVIFVGFLLFVGFSKLLEREIQFDNGANKFVKGSSKSFSYDEIDFIFVEKHTGEGSYYYSIVHLFTVNLQLKNLKRVKVVSTINRKHADEIVSKISNFTSFETYLPPKISVRY